MNLFSCGVKWNGCEISKAHALKKEAMILGVPEKDILTEEMSLPTLENVFASFPVLDGEFRLNDMCRF